MTQQLLHYDGWVTYNPSTGQEGFVKHLLCQAPCQHRVQGQKGSYLTHFPHAPTPLLGFLFSSEGFTPATSAPLARSRHFLGTDLQFVLPAVTGTGLPTEFAPGLNPRWLAARSLFGPGKARVLFPVRTRIPP